MQRCSQHRQVSNIVKFSLSTFAIAFLMFLASVGVSVGQKVEISEPEYWAAIRESYAATRKAFPRRESEMDARTYGESKTYLLTEVSEYLSSDTYRVTKVVDRNGAKELSEVIQIGRTRYCRENLGDWMTLKCYQQPPPPLGKADETTYSVENGKKSKTYIRIARSRELEKGNKEPTQYITEDKLILNNDSTVRERTITRFIADSKKVVSREVQKYEYKIKPKKIEAPIK